MSAPQPARTLFRYVLRLGDLSLVLGQRLGEWVGHSPRWKRTWDWPILRST